MKLRDVMNITTSETMLVEIQIGGEVDSAPLYDLARKHDFSPKQLTMFSGIPSEPHLPTSMKLVGRLGPYFITRRQDDTSRYQGEATYYLFDSGKPVAYVAVIHPDNEDFGGGYHGRRYRNPQINGVGLRVISIYLDPEIRGKKLSVALYEWLLNNVCDYLLPDDLQTRGGVYIWQQLVRDPRFDVEVWNYETHQSYPAKPGATWMQVYKSGKLFPFVTLAGKAEQLLYETSTKNRGLCEAAIPGGDAYWFNPANGDVVTVSDHGEGVMEDPYHFGIDSETVRDMIEAFPDGCDEDEPPDDDTDCDDLPPPPEELLFTDGDWHRNDAWEQLAMNRGWVRCGVSYQNRFYISAATAEAAWAATKFVVQHHYVETLDIEISGKQASIFVALDERKVTMFQKAGPRRALEYLKRLS